MCKQIYNIIANTKIIFFLLIIFITLVNGSDLNKIIKFQKDGNIIILDKKNNNITKTHLYSPLVYIKMDESNINFRDNNIFVSENGDFTYTIPEQDISLIDISFEEITTNSPLILKKYPNLLFKSNKTFSLFSININDGYLIKYEKYNSNFLEKNNFKFIKHICPNDEDEVLFLRIDYFIQMKYTYNFNSHKTYNNNNDIIWYSHHIKIVPIYPKVNLTNSDIYENNFKNFDKDDFYIFEIDNETINILYSQDKDLYVEMKDIENDFNFNNHYFGNKKRDNLFKKKILLFNENTNKTIFFKFPKTSILLISLLCLIMLFLKNKIRQKINKNNIQIIITNEVKIKVVEEDKKDKKEISYEENNKLNNNKAKSNSNLEGYFNVDKNENKIKNSAEKNLRRYNKIKSFYKPFSTKKKELLSLKKINFRKSYQSFKKKKPATEMEKSELNQLFSTYLEDIKKNSINNDSTINLNIKTISIADKYKKLYLLLEEENEVISSSNSTQNYKKEEIDKENQILLKKEFQNNFNYFIDSGRLLKEFKDFHFIGKGGFGVVLKASNILDEGQYAIKIMRINLDLRKAKELNAIQEIKMMLKFKKKNIVRYNTCWFEFEFDQNNISKKRIRSISFDKNYNENKSDEIKLNKYFEQKIPEKHKRKNSVICDGDKEKNSKKICYEEEKEKEKIKTKKTVKSMKQRKPKKEKRKTSNVWDDDDDDLDEDSLGANKNYVIKEEGENINLDDDFNEEEEEENSAEEDDDNSSFFDDNNQVPKKEIIKESSKDKENIDSSVDLSKNDEYNNLKPKKNIRVNESSSNIIDTNSNNSNYIENNNNKENENKNSNTKLIIYFFIQMEYCSGCPMNYYLSHRSSIPSKALTSYMFFQMCYAVKHIHEANIIHRDLKPGNIFIMKDYLIKIGDFGLALNLGKTKNEQGGTYLYQSPEQIQNKIYDQKVDIFALGVILVELVSKFNTEYERVEVLRGLKNDLYPNYLEKDHLNELNLIKKMTRLNADERPNIQDIFTDNDFIMLINSH